MENLINESKNEKEQKTRALEFLQQELNRKRDELNGKINDQRSILHKSQLDHAVKSALQECREDRRKMEEEHQKELAEEKK